MRYRNTGMQSLFLVSLVLAISINPKWTVRERGYVSARSHANDFDVSPIPPLFVWTRSSRLSRYTSKIVSAERRDDSSCRRAKDAGKVGPSLSNSRHTCRTCTRCHFRCACVSGGVRKHLFIARIRIDRRSYGFQDAAGDRAVPRIFSRCRRRSRRSYDSAFVARRQRPSSKRFVLSRRQRLISLRSPYVADLFRAFNSRSSALTRSSNAVASRCGSTASRLRSSGNSRF